MHTCSFACVLLCVCVCVCVCVCPLPPCSHLLGMLPCVYLFVCVCVLVLPFPSTGDLPRMLPLINRHFSLPTVTQIRDSLLRAEDRLATAEAGAQYELDWTRGAIEMLNK